MGTHGRLPFGRLVARDGPERRAFGLTNVQPPELPESPADMYAFLDVPEHLHNPAYASRISLQWAAHRAAWKPPAEDAPLLTPRHVHNYWANLEPSAKELSSLGCYHWRRPISSASVERVYSALTGMDHWQPKRRSMEVRTLRHTLFLRGYWRVVVALAQRLADEITAHSGVPGLAREQETKAKLVASAAAALLAERNAAEGAGAGGAGGDAAGAGTPGDVAAAEGDDIFDEET